MNIRAIAAGAWALIKAWWPAIVAILLVAPVIFLLGQCDGKSTQKAKTEARTAKAQLEQANRDRDADANLNQAKQHQAAAIAADRKEVDDATAAIPDRAPSPRQRARACLELRRQAAAKGAAQPAC